VSEAGYVSRAGRKLEHALREFEVDVSGLVCADLGCHVGGFTDCLLRHGAVQVYAVDTGYGILDYSLRTDPRVVVMERTNALHAEPPADGVDLVVIDLGWTPQRLAIPAACRWVRPTGWILTLIKPHYELSGEEKTRLLDHGRLEASEAERVAERVLEQLPTWGARLVHCCRSPLTGGKSSRGKGRSGNVEFLALARPDGF
jgi:23S rRNA (cytidine1920-2'-O)/16S rRNA (cytidine1409-2'-O)-methyltransferase